jgi:hypothetical protein
MITLLCDELNGSDPPGGIPPRGVKTRPEALQRGLAAVQVGRVLPVQPWAISGKSTIYFFDAMQRAKT